MTQAWPWIAFNLFVFVMLALDLGVFQKKAHAVKVKEALLLSAFWIALALLFNLGVYMVSGPEKALQFTAGYLLEKSLSVDNIFVFILVFKCFRVSPVYQHKILFWGILGALVMRAIFILVGITLIERFHWTIYIFGVFLIFTGLRMAFGKEKDEDKELDPEKSLVIRLFKKVMPVTTENVEGKFFVRKAGRLYATPFFIVLLVVETTDVIFAVDSIPAVLAITTDPFIVYTSNVFAILGLRALYFALSGVMQVFHHLHYGLSAILVFVGAKMLLTDVYHFPIVVALLVIAAILTASIAASIIWPKKPADCRT